MKNTNFTIEDFKKIVENSANNNFTDEHFFYEIESSLIKIVQNSLREPWSLEHFILLVSCFLFKEIFHLQTKIFTYNNKTQYDLSVMQDGLTPEKNKIYIRSRKEHFIEYTVISPNGKQVTDQINQKNVCYSSGIEMIFPKNLLTPENLKPFLGDLLKITSRRGHTHPENIVKEQSFIFHDYPDIYAVKNIPDKRELSDYYKSSYIFLINSNHFNFFYISQDASPIAFPFKLTAKFLNEINDDKNPLSGEINKNFKKLIFDSLVSQTINEIIEYHKMHFSYLKENREFEKPKNLIDFLKIESFMGEYFEFIKQFSGKCHNYMIKIDLKLNPLALEEHQFRCRLLNLKIHENLRRLILFDKYCPDEEKREGLPRGEIFDIKQAAEFLTKNLGHTISETNVLEYCCKNEFQIYLDREHDQFQEEYVKFIDIELAIRCGFIEENYPYFFDGLIRLSDIDGLTKLRNGGIIKSDDYFPILSSMSEYLSGKRLKLVSKNDSEKIEITKFHLRFRKEELIKFIQKENSKSKKCRHKSQPRLNKLYKITVYIIKIIGEKKDARDITADEVFNKLSNEGNGKDYDRQGWIKEITDENIEYFVNHGKKNKKIDAVKIENYIERTKKYLQEYKDDPQKFIEKYKEIFLEIEREDD